MKKALESLNTLTEFNLENFYAIRLQKNEISLQGRCSEILLKDLADKDFNLVYKTNDFWFEGKFNYMDIKLNITLTL